MRSSRSYVTSPTDSIGKENLHSADPHPASLRSKLSSPPLVGGGGSNPGYAPPPYAPSTASPRRTGLAGPDGEISRATTTGSMQAMAGSQQGGGPDREGWKRAAEVTQNLKARIEMMKVCSFWTVQSVC